MTLQFYNDTLDIASFLALAMLGLSLGVVFADAWHSLGRAITRRSRRRII